MTNVWEMFDTNNFGYVFLTGKIIPVAQSYLHTLLSVNRQQAYYIILLLTGHKTPFIHYFALTYGLTNYSKTYTRHYGNNFRLHKQLH